MKYNSVEVSLGLWD